MKFRLLGLVLLCISAAGFIVVVRHAGAELPAESTWWELLLSLICVPLAAVGLPLLVFGAAMTSPTRMPRRRRSIRFDKL